MAFFVFDLVSKYCRLCEHSVSETKSLLNAGGLVSTVDLKLFFFSPVLTTFFNHFFSTLISVSLFIR